MGLGSFVASDSYKDLHPFLILFLESRMFMQDLLKDYYTGTHGRQNHALVLRVFSNVRCFEHAVYHQSKPQHEFNQCLIAVGQDDLSFGDTILSSSNVPSCGERDGEMCSVFSGFLFLNEYSKCLCIRHWKKLLEYVL